MLFLKFLHHPSTIQNDSQEKVSHDVSDIIINGYRRSLSDWLVIVGKTYEQYLSLRKRGYSLKTAILYGVSYQRSNCFRTRDLVTSHKVLLLPTKLSQHTLRQNRICAWLYWKHKGELTIPQCSLIASYALTHLYQAYRKGEAWKPDKHSLWPWTKSIPLTQEESFIWKTIHSSPLFLYTEEGIYPSQQLKKWFTSHKLKKNAFLLEWFEKFKTFNSPLHEKVNLSELAKHCGVTRKSMYRSFKEKGLDITGGKTLAELLILAQKADEKMTTKRIYRSQGYIGVKRRKKEKKAW